MQKRCRFTDNGGRGVPPTHPHFFFLRRGYPPHQSDEWTRGKGLAGLFMGEHSQGV